MSKIFGAIKELLITLIIAVLNAMVLKFFIIDSCKFFQVPWNLPW